MKTRIIVKAVSKNPLQLFQFEELPRSNRQVAFVFDRDCRFYDWLFVYDDLPSSAGERLPLSCERLACARSRSILMTYEPSSIKHYGADYVGQFGTVMTSQEQYALQHPNRVTMPPIGVWFYGGVQELAAHPSPPPKNRDLSVFGSGKRMKHSLHAARYRFLNDLMLALEDKADVYGHGYRYVATKSAALDEYRYHVAVENHIGPDHWTEKLSDPFLGYCLPFYVGCTNAEDYFPAESFIELDIRDSRAAVARIRRAIEAGEYERRLPAIVEARRRVVEEYSLGNCISRYVSEHHDDTASTQTDGSSILSRHALMRSSPRALLRYGTDKIAMRRFHRSRWRQYLSQGK